MRMYVSVLMPAYNEGDKIEDSVCETLRVLNSLNVEHEIIVINDGSKDNTEDVVKALCERYDNVRLVSYYPNMGKGYALRRGFSVSGGDVIVFIDSDLDIHPSQIKPMLEQIKVYDVVIGSKYLKGSNVKVTFKRKIFSKFYRILTRLLLKLNVSDTQVGLKVFRRYVLERVFPLVTVNRYAFDVELLTLIAMFGYTIYEMPVSINGHYNSSVNYKEILRMFKDTLSVFYKKSILHAYGGGYARPVAKLERYSTS
jgi:glycosyltransferase involved in cell wall biosynthesis